MFVFLVIISPVSAYSSPWTKFTDGGFLGYVYDGDTFSVNDLDSMKSRCAAQGANWTVWSPEDQQDSRISDRNKPWPHNDGTVGARSTKIWTMTSYYPAGTKFMLGTDCYDSNHVYEIAPFSNGYYIKGSGSRPAVDISLSASPSSGTPSFMPKIS